MAWSTSRKWSYKMGQNRQISTRAILFNLSRNFFILATIQWLAFSYIAISINANLFLKFGTSAMGILCSLIAWHLHKMALIGSEKDGKKFG